jgi:hypothetical protein
MALQSLSASELADTRTVLASFMGQRIGEAEKVGNRKTVGELLEIYKERSKTLPPAEDAAEDLRVERFIDDMAHGQWSSEVVVRIGVFDDTVLVVDGIHRSIAYLACVEEGVDRARLPPLHVDC